MKRKIDVPHIDRERRVSLKSMGNIKEIAISDRMNAGATIHPLSKDKYVLLSTGEIKSVVHHAKDRTENLRNLEKTMHNLSDIINANISPENAHRCRFITFTYRENMTDAEKLYTDFKNFNKRFKRSMEKVGYHYEYIISIEAQARGAFHIHGIFIFSTRAPFIDNKELAGLWGHGFVSVKAIGRNIDNVGKYLTSYLTDLPVDTDAPAEALGGEVKEVDVNGESKWIIKGARLKLLPVGIRIYRYSRGIRKPVVEKMSYKEASEIISETGYSLVNEYAVEITDVERDFKTNYIKKTYKKFINSKGGDDHEDKS